MRKQTLYLPYSSPNLNDLIRATNDASAQRGKALFAMKLRRQKPGRVRVRDMYTEVKNQWATRVLAHSREQRIKPFPCGAHVRFCITEVDRRRDPDNLASGAMKLILDGLVRCGVLPSDDWRGVLSLSFEFAINPNKGSVEVTLTEEA